MEEHGADTILAAMERLSPPETAQVTISTAHRAKGMEWDRVRIAGDFDTPTDKETGEQRLPERDDLMLAYVAVTRAKKHLDLGGLSWVNNFTGPHARPRTALDLALETAVRDMETGVGVRRGRYIA